LGSNSRTNRLENNRLYFVKISIIKIIIITGAVTGLVVTDQQCHNKWDSLKRGYENSSRIIMGNPDNFPLRSPNRFDRELFNEMSDEFWLRAGI
jgi:hypothetical protein